VRRAIAGRRTAVAYAAFGAAVPAPPTSYFDEIAELFAQAPTPAGRGSPAERI
jgi:hypothetical protein